MQTQIHIQIHKRRLIQQRILYISLSDVYIDIYVYITLHLHIHIHIFLYLACRVVNACGTALPARRGGVACRAVYVVESCWHAVRVHARMRHHLVSQSNDGNAFIHAAVSTATVTVTAPPSSPFQCRSRLRWCRVWVRVSGRARAPGRGKGFPPRRRGCKYLWVWGVCRTKVVRPRVCRGGVWVWVVCSPDRLCSPQTKACQRGVC